MIRIVTIKRGNKVLNNDVTPGFKNSLALKDLKLALEQGSLDGINLNTGKTALKVYEDADKTSYKDLDNHLDYWNYLMHFKEIINYISRDKFTLDASAC